MSFLEMTTPEPIKSTYVGGEGPMDCKICIVGDAPGKEEIAFGRPFVGPAGRELDKLLYSAGINRQECYITNVIKEQPKPTNQDIKKFIDAQHGTVSTAGKQYLDILKEELTQCDANIFVALGSVALFALTSLTGITKWGGSILESSLLPGKKVISSFHPSTLVGQKSVYLNKHLIVFDLRRAKEESEYSEIRLPAMHFHTQPTFNEAITWLHLCYQKGLEGHVIDWDIETTWTQQLNCWAFTWNDYESMSIPFVYSQGNYWTPEQEAEVLRAGAFIIEDPRIVKRGENLMFDGYVCLRNHGIRPRNMIDTMIAQAVLYPDYKKGLSMVVRMHTRLPYYKDDRNQWWAVRDWKKHWEYNCKDTIATALSYPSQMKQLKQMGNVETYKRQEKLIEPLLFMEHIGIKVNLVKLKMAKESVEKEIISRTERLYKMCGKELNFKSPSQMTKYFYTDKKIKPYINKDTKKPRCDDDALMRIARKGHPEAQLIREIRTLHTLHSRYLTVELDADNRVRSSINPVGAKTGRLSSSATVYGTGMNLQNLPPEIREFLDFDGIGFEVDLSQAENRIVAYCGPVPEMIECFENHQDVHSKTASLIFGIPADEIKQMDKAHVMCTTLAEGKYTHRFWGKRANHGLNYNLGPINFAERYDIPIADAKFIHARYHAVYPGVRNGYHNMLRTMIFRNRMTINPFGRRRLYLNRLDDTLMQEAYNNFAQSTVADIIDERGIEYIYYNQLLLPDVQLLLQIHDSIIFQFAWTTSPEEIVRQYFEIIKSLEKPIQWLGRQFVIPAEGKMSIGHFGKNDHDPLALQDISNDPVKLLKQVREAMRVHTNV
jgi:uracil-DNA glycosylase family 4